MNYKAYITNYEQEDERVKIFAMIYDSDLPTQWEEIDNDGSKQTIIRPEYAITIHVPYNQSEDYIKSRVKEALEKFRNRQKDLDKLNNLKNSNEQIS